MLYNRYKQQCSARKRNLPCQLLLLKKKKKKKKKNKNVTNPEKSGNVTISYFQI